MTVSWLNRFRVLCGLVEIAFTRAVHSRTLHEKGIYLPSDKVLKEDDLKKFLRVKNK
jgi:hypothetical protein